MEDDDDVGKWSQSFSSSHAAAFTRLDDQKALAPTLFWAPDDFKWSSPSLESAGGDFFYSAASQIGRDERATERRSDEVIIVSNAAKSLNERTNEQTDGRTDTTKRRQEGRNERVKWIIEIH